MSKRHVTIDNVQRISDLSRLDIDPVTLKFVVKSPTIEHFIQFKEYTIDDVRLQDIFRKKKGVYLHNFVLLRNIIFKICKRSNSLKYYILINQLADICNNIVTKVITLHLQDCVQISRNPNHNSLKYLHLPSKRRMILQDNKKNILCCKVCARGIN